MGQNTVLTRSQVSARRIFILGIMVPSPSSKPPSGRARRISLGAGGSRLRTSGISSRSILDLELSHRHTNWNYLKPTWIFLGCHSSLFEMI